MNANLKDALAKLGDGECWTGEEVDCSVAAAAVARVVSMGSEPAVLDRVYPVHRALEDLLTSGSVERVFRDALRRYKACSANIIRRPCKNIGGRLASARMLLLSLLSTTLMSTVLFLRSPPT